VKNSKLGILTFVASVVFGSIAWDAHSSSTRLIEANLLRGLSTVQIKNGLATYNLPVSQSTSTLTLATNSDASSLSNKTINGSVNTLLGVSRSALVAGTAQKVVVNDSSGNLSDGPAPGSDGNVLTASGGVWTSAANTATLSTSVITISSSSYTATTSSNVILYNANGAASTLNLYTAVGNKGRELIISKIDTTSNCVTLDGNASETIRGDTTKKLCSPGESVKIISDNSGWQVEAHTFSDDPRSAAVTSNWTNTTVTASYTRYNKWAFLDIYLLATNSVTGGQLILTLPASLTMDVAGFPGATATDTKTYVGECAAYDSGTVYHGTLYYHSTTTFIGTAQTTNANMGDLTNAAPFAMDTADSWFCRVRIPVTDWW
jgi:hypothetical protein